MTSTEPAAAARPPAPAPVPPPTLPAARMLVLTVVVAAAVALLPALAAAVVPAPQAPVGPGTTVDVPTPEEPAFRLTPPAGWTESAVPSGEGRPLVYTRGTDTLSVYAATGTAGADVYAARLVRLAAARSDITAVPDGRASGPDGLSGPRLRVTGSTGDTGELVVLGRGDRVVALLVLAGPDRPVDLRPVVASLRVAS